MNKNPGAKQFWRLCGPLLLYWLIEFVVSTAAGMIVMAPHIADMIGKEIMAGGEMTQQEMTDLYMQNFESMLEVMARYQVQILVISALCTIPLTYFLFHSDRKKERTLNLPLNKKAGPLKYVQIIVLGAAVCIGLNCLSAMTNLAFASAEYQETSEMFYSADLWLQFIGTGLIIPLAEELMYRGVLFKRYRERGGFLRAALCSALIFSLVHGNMVQLLYAFILGMLLAYVYEKYGSFRAPVALHIAANMTSLVLTNANGFNWLLEKTPRMAIVTVACAFVGSAMFVLIQKIDEKPEVS